MFLDVWDRRSGTVIASLSSEDELRTLLQDMVAHEGEAVIVANIFVTRQEMEYLPDSARVLSRNVIVLQGQSVGVLLHD